MVLLLPKIKMEQHVIARYARDEMESAMAGTQNDFPPPGLVPQIW